MAHTNDVNCVQFHPTKGDILASCSDDGKIKIWKVELEGWAAAESMQGVVNG
jgi:WD40 repeat protein